MAWIGAGHLMDGSPMELNDFGKKLKEAEPWTSSRPRYYRVWMHFGNCFDASGFKYFVGFSWLSVGFPGSERLPRRASECGPEEE